MTSDITAGGEDFKETVAPAPATMPHVETDIEQLALRLARRANPGGEGFRPVGTFEDSLGGTLVFVDFISADVPDDVCVFIDRTNVTTILSAEQLARRIKMQFPSTFWRLIGSPSSFSGFIALIITCTICYIVLRTSEFSLTTVPSVLSGPLAVIVGFYFGRYALAGTSILRDAAKKALAEYDGSAKHVTVTALVTQFLNGDLAILSYENSQTTDWESYAYLTAEDVIIYDDKRSLGELAHSYRPPTAWQNFVSVTTFGGVLAVIICVTLCATVIMQPGLQDPVPVLSNSLTTILAFYFGTQAAKS